jgi:hypothetical protein
VVVAFNQRWRIEHLAIAAQTPAMLNFAGCEDEKKGGGVVV